MQHFRSFEDMEVWKEARLLLRAIRQICRNPRVEKDHSFTDQITRSARSISANIAEGSDAMTIPEFIHYLGIAKRSCTETRSHLYDVLDEHYVDRNQFDCLNDQCKKICCMLAKLIHHLQKLDPTMKRTFRINELTN